MSTANAFVLRGAVPVFVDIDPATQNISPQSVERAITPRTRAIVAVHYAGVGCDMSAEQRAFPILQTLDAIVIRELRRATDQKAVTDFFFIFVLGPTIAVGAKRDFLPLSGLMR